MDDFEKEAGEAFLEVSTRGMPVQFRLTNEQFSGVIQSTAVAVNLTEPGYDRMDEIVVYSPRVLFSVSPEQYAREILQVDSGPQQGQWVVQSADSDLAHYIFICKPSE